VQWNDGVGFEHCSNRFLATLKGSEASGFEAIIECVKHSPAASAADDGDGDDDDDDDDDDSIYVKTS
jgi:hypothetical protein